MGSWSCSFFFAPGAMLSMAMIPLSRYYSFSFSCLFSSSFLMYEITPFFTVDTYLWG